MDRGGPRNQHFEIGIGELALFLVVALLVFGGRLPEVAGKAARAIGEFRRTVREEMNKVHRAVEEPPPDYTPPPDGEDCEGL